MEREVRPVLNDTIFSRKFQASEERLRKPSRSLGTNDSLQLFRLYLDPKPFGIWDSGTQVFPKKIRVVRERPQEEALPPVIAQHVFGLKHENMPASVHVIPLTAVVSIRYSSEGLLEWSSGRSRAATGTKRLREEDGAGGLA